MIVVALLVGGDSRDNALAASIIGLYTAEVIHRRGPWRTLDDVEYATLDWWIGSTIVVCARRSAMSRRRSSIRLTIIN